MRKALSQVMSALLLVLVSVASSSLVYLLVSGMIASQAVAVRVGSTQVVIEAAVCSYSSCTLYVRSAGGGGVPAGEWSLYVYSGSELVSQGFREVSLSPGETAAVVFSLLKPIAPGEYRLKLVTPAGSVAFLSVKVP